MPALAPMLDGVEFVPPHIRYTGSMNLDLGGGLIVEFREFGGAHSLGDQGILIRGSASVLFTGDLVEEGTFGVLGDSDSHTVPWLDRVKRFEQLNPDIVVPGHGLIGGPERLADYRAYLGLAIGRVTELRVAGELSEAEIVERVSAEVLGLHPDWKNQIWARKAVEDLTWPARALPATRAPRRFGRGARARQIIWSCPDSSRCRAWVGHTFHLRNPAGAAGFGCCQAAGALAAPAQAQQEQDGHTDPQPQQHPQVLGL